jgi:hypothetical protein
MGPWGRVGRRPERPVPDGMDAIGRYALRTEDNLQPSIILDVRLAPHLISVARAAGCRDGQAMRIGELLPYDRIDSPLDYGRCRFWRGRRCFRVFWPVFLATLDAFDASGILTDASGCVFSTMENRPFHGKTACSPNQPATRWRNCEGMERA